MVPAVLEKKGRMNRLCFCITVRVRRSVVRIWGIFQKLVIPPAFTDEYKRLIRKRSWIIIGITCREKIWMPVWR